MTLNNRIKMIQDNQEQFIVEMKETQKQQKQIEYIKSELDGLLWAELMESNNIFDDEIKSVVIDTCMNNSDVLLYNKDYTRQYLNKRYYTIARQVEQIKKKTAPKNQDDYKKQIAIEKWDLQRQKELLKIKQLEQKIAQNEQKYNMRQAPKQPAKQVHINRSGNGSEVTKVLLYLMFAPIAIFGLIIYGFISAAAKNQK
jgi:hypothetical protein